MTMSGKRLVASIEAALCRWITRRPAVKLTWEPRWGVPPGELLREVLDDRKMTQAELARRMKRPTKTINEIINGKAQLTPATAIQLEAVLGIPDSFWNTLEVRWREYLARKDAGRL